MTTTEFVLKVAIRSLGELPIGRGAWGRRARAFDEDDEDRILARVLAYDLLPKDVSAGLRCSTATLYAVLRRAAERNGVTCRFNGTEPDA